MSNNKNKILISLATFFYSFKRKILLSFECGLLFEHEEIKKNEEEFHSTKKNFLL